jgi:hypothetical protein
MQVRYGIEALFMQKDLAVRTEQIALKEKVGAPMNVQVAVGGSGISVLKDFEWEPLGITIELDQLPRANTVPPQPQVQNRQPGLTGLTVSLHNYSENDVAVVDLPGRHSFRLIPNDRFQAPNYTWAGKDRVVKLPAPRGEAIVVLKPGEVHKVHIDLTDERWWILDVNKPDSVAFPMQQVENGWAASFRIEYVPASAETLAGLPNAELVRHAPLRTRAFNANRGID